MANTGQQRFSEFIQAHLHALRRAAYRLCRSRSDAEDLVQDVCLRVFEKVAQLEHIESPRAWLLRVQYNLHIDAARRRPPGNTESFDELAPPLPEISAACDPQADAETALLIEALDRIWADLNRDQQALLAFYAEGYSLNELAAITQLPVGAIKARLHRARVRLGKLLEADMGRAHQTAISGESA
jgi:RNA polymerase sigma-70 factor (ECF subfamily)